MTVLRKDRIQRHGARGMNMQAVAEATDDLKQHIEIGKVTAEVGDSHFTIEDGDIWVDVRLVPTDQPVTCRLTTIAGGPGNGVWMVPPDGTEVVVAFPQGMIEGGGIIIAVLPSANLPSGVAQDQMVIVAPKVLVYDSNDGNANPVATKADIDALAGHVDTHTHPDPASGFTGTPADISGPQVSPLAVGTQVLEAE